MQAKVPPIPDVSAGDFSAFITLLAGVQIFEPVPAPFRAPSRSQEGSEKGESRQKDLRQKNEKLGHQPFPLLCSRCRRLIPDPGSPVQTPSLRAGKMSVHAGSQTLLGACALSRLAEADALRALPDNNRTEAAGAVDMQAKL